MSDIQFEFDRAISMTAAEAKGALLVWNLNISDQWSFGNAPNGGYMAALLAKAISVSSPRHSHPMSVTTQYIAPAKPQTAQI